jgi:hypothetical protein
MLVLKTQNFMLILNPLKRFAKKLLREKLPTKMLHKNRGFDFYYRKKG